MIKEINGEQASRLLLRGHRISMHTDMVPYYVLHDNGTPVMINKTGELQPLFSNLDAYVTFLNKLTEEHVWYYDDSGDIT